MRRMKKWLALVLAACLAVPTVSGTVYSDMQIVQAAEQNLIYEGSDIAITEGTALDDTTILEATYPDEAQMGAAISQMFTHTERDNTWVFTGGEAVQGGFDQTRGIRNYIGQYEEYIRWTLGGSSAINGRQRFTFSTGKAGLTLSDVVDNYDTLAADFETKAAVYMVGVEDYSQGEAKLEEFKTDLKSFIDKSLALKADGSSFAVIQKPYAVNDDTTNAEIQKYCAAVDEVAESYKEETAKYTHIVVVDHFTQTNTDDFKTNMLQEDGTLNAEGHLEIARQLALATSGVSGDFPCAGVTLDLVEEEQPEQYVDVQPTVTATDSSLKVEIPETEGTSWKYELELDDVVITGTADSNAFEIVDLIKDSSYVLKIQSQDGKKQLVTTKGTVTNNAAAVKNTQELSVNQQKIADLVNGEKPVTWLFMGDSITHGIRFTYGYDGIAQIFEKFVKEELGRADDIVLNTAVSNANSQTTIQEIDQRLEKFNPDVVSIMLGTNDSSSTVDISADEFKANMVTIIEKIKEVNPNAVIILRSPTPVFDSARLPYIDSYVEKVVELAETYDLIYVDQYTELKEATKTYNSWLTTKLFPDSLHPGANGQRIMANMFLKACGLWTEDSVMTNLFYDLGIAEESKELETEILAGADKLGVNVTDLKKDSGLSFGNVIVKATSQTSGQSYEMTAKAGETYAVLRDLPGETTYDVEISGYLTDSAKKVTFASQQVTLSDDQDFSEEVTLLKAGSINVSAENMTEDQPFASGTGDSSKFRIPALITLENGDLLAAADARWTGGADWGGLDTIASVSSDNGKTWYYSFPIYFPDSNNIYPGMEAATTVIDPVLVQGPDETIYCIADMNPSGITTGDIMPAFGTGFVEIDGEWRLALTGTYTKPNESDLTTYGDPEDYEYYVGDFDENGFAPVLNKADGSATQYGVDEWYNIYTINAETGAYEEALTQTMVNESTVIQQNAFYKDSVLHVYNTGYLWLVTSKDNGRTWENPQILNTQIKRDSDRALLASPGQGITTSDGDIVIPFYDHGNGAEYASVIWSSDNGKTWTRSNDAVGGWSTDGSYNWSSESEVVELNNGVLRMFFRNGTGYICYADITKVDGEWVMSEGIRTSISVCSTCNVTAIRHSETIDGKVVVMVACPGGSGRANGKIFTFLVDDDNTMELYNTFAVNEGTYAYSCMTELADGNIGLLWENQGTAIRYDSYTFGEVIGTEKNITIDPEEQYVEETIADAALEITQAPNESIATVTSEFIVEESTTVLHDHVSNTDSSLASFSETAGTGCVEEAEFTFTANGDNWQIYNESKGLYLTNESVASTFFSSTAGDMQVTAVEGEFRICKSGGTRYVIFHYPNMDFNSNSAYNASMTTGSYEVVLLEKQDTVSAEDVVPGYKRVSEITSGKKYLISYLWGTDTETTEDDGVIVLYPTNGTAEQTKLVGDTTDVAKNVLTITGIAPGKTTAVVGDIIYNITVNDPTTSPSYAGNDIPVEKMTATAGSEQANAGAAEGPVSLAFDGDINTHYHSSWSPQASEDQLWIQLELEEVTYIGGLRYLPRSGAGNGTISKYEILYSVDGENWTTAAEGSWAIDTEWKIARFETPVEAKYIKLVAVDSTADNNGRHMSAAEIRLIKGEESPVTRLYGADRYGTSFAVAEEYQKVLGVEEFDAVIVATGQKAADALSGSCLAAQKKAPILLTEPGKEASLIEYVKENLTAGGKVYLLGGTGVVSEELETDLGTLGYSVKRLKGTDRYGTNLAILEEAGITGNDLLVATGEKEYDSLSASATNKPILLVNTEITEAQKEVLEGLPEGSKIWILGGTGAVSADIEAELKEYSNDVERVKGADRYATSVEIAKTFFGEDAAKVTMAYGEKFPDGLCGGPLAAEIGAPVLLVKEGGTDKAAVYAANAASGYVFGGSGVIADETVKAVLGEEIKIVGQKYE